MAVYRSATGGSGGSVTINDDGSNYDFVVGGSTRFKIRQSDNQLLLDAGATDDAF